MRAGTLRDRITLQRRATPEDRDEYGSEDITWVDVATVWAEEDMVYGVEFWGGQQMHHRLDGKFRIRRRDDVRPQWRIAQGTRRLEIMAVQRPPEDRAEMVLLYRELVD